MKTKLTLFFALLLAVAFVNPLSAQVKSDYDKNADFTTYKTYTFSGWQKDSDKKLNDFDKKRITDALISEFDKRGMKFIAEGSADANIALYVVIEKKTSTTAYTNYVGGMGYRGRWGWGMGSGYATTNYSESDYNEGTLVIDMYDKDSKDLVWQGVLTTAINDKAKKREKTIPKKIAKLMKEYPIKASK